MPLIEGGCNLAQGCGAARLNVGNDRPNVSSPALGLARSEGSTGECSLPGREVDLPTVPAELRCLASKAKLRLLLIREPRIEGPLAGKGILGPPGNHLPLMLRHRRKDMNRQV